MAELALVGKVTLVLAFALLAVNVASRRSAAMRSLMLVCTFGLLILLPLASFLLPAQAVEVPDAYTATLSSVGLTAAAPSLIPPAAIDNTPHSFPRFAMPSLRAVSLTVWAAGVAGFALPLTVALFRLRRLHTHGRTWTSPSHAFPVEVLLNDNVRVPITYGVVRPVVTLPADAPQWSDADLRRVLLHELEHVRRRDWPVHMMARAVCALYWFHPLVWIAWQRLRLESERACDDAVLREEDAAAYASQLVALARRLTRQHATPLLSIAGPSHLATRVKAVLAGNLARGPVRRTAAIAIASVATVATLGIGPLKAVSSIQRSAPQRPGPALAFESMTIRPTTPSNAATAPCCQVRYSTDGRMSAANVGLVNLVATAYGVYLWQIDKAPSWADADPWGKDGDRFDIDAFARRNASAEDQRSMLKTMLADRFHLAVHTETRTQKIYELVVDPGGSKLLAPGPNEYRESDDIWLNVNPNQMIATLDVGQWTMAQLARHLGFPLQTMVRDRTGVAGVHHVKATWSAAASPTIFEAFPAQLGLRLRETSGPVEYLVVDRAERPRLDTR